MMVPMNDGDQGTEKRAGGQRPGPRPLPLYDDGGGDVALILCELRRLEERISGLEAQLERSGKQPEGSAQRPGSVASPPKHQKRKRGQTKQQS